ncbi:RNA polymerase sigma factor [Limnoglobus roseus]|uniref:Sigma-70 family RNA polymerase sigma factor n=1 Tax=Limnoglobus roseus TaxID=2598579 RepID=A0A5C1A7I3_9BACT|nr:sigma-70 family RNA polymerase sigma factor [Limnoglobus roseus]QEL14690.1 sigma-70 family RNA polymerase sigma factor [Limnoglobus roseus]
MSTDSDRLLVQHIRAGGAKADAAWEELVARYEGRLGAFVRKRLRDHGTSDDVVQETFIGFLNSLANYDDKRDLQTWLFTIASHKVTDQLRRIGRRPFQTGSEADEEMMGKAADGRQRPASSLARSKERLDLEHDAVARCLRDMIGAFRQKGEFQRIQVLELLFVKGWPNKEVAAFVGVNEQQVANYRFAAVKKLTEQMKSAGLPVEVFPELTLPDDLN